MRQVYIKIVRDLMKNKGFTKEDFWAYKECNNRWVILHLYKKHNEDDLSMEFFKNDIFMHPIEKQNDWGHAVYELSRYDD